ncbi:MAG: ParB N-terminal domain-containing protein [Prevotella sp.]|nr:ParB N-terminal domain-containing protein [Prevotella sp.]
MDKKMTAPLSTFMWVDRNMVKPNGYNPNKVSKQNLELLKQSILVNGWTLPIVTAPDFTIIDGYHRWTVAGEEPLFSMLEGKVPVVIVEHENKAGNIYGTVTHNRARGTHLLEPMKNIIKELMAEGRTVEEIGKQLGMKPEEVFRLSDFSREDFLRMMAKDSSQYNRAEFITRL